MHETLMLSDSVRPCAPVCINVCASGPPTRNDVSFDVLSIKIQFENELQDPLAAVIRNLLRVNLHTYTYIVYI